MANRAENTIHKPDPEWPDLVFMLNCYDRWSGPLEPNVPCEDVEEAADAQRGRESPS